MSVICMANARMGPPHVHLKIDTPSTRKFRSPHASRTRTPPSCTLLREKVKRQNHKTFNAQPSCCCDGITFTDPLRFRDVKPSHHYFQGTSGDSDFVRLQRGSPNDGGNYKVPLFISQKNNRGRSAHTTFTAMQNETPAPSSSAPPQLTDAPSATQQQPNASRKQKMKVVIVGGGVGGLAVAGRLAKEGMHVTVLEKNADLGGRLQSVHLGVDEEFRFDTGPSLMLMPEKYREAFKELGESLDSYVEIRRVDPVAYRVFFAGDEKSAGHLDLLYDVQRMCAQLEGVEAGAGAAYLRFLANAKEALDKGTKNFIERDFRTLADYADIPRLLPLVARLSPFDLLGQHHARMATYFRDPRLCALFTFQDLYVGLSPYNAPGVFSLLAATEITDGVWYPVGGFGEIRRALATAATNRGAELRTSTPVAGIRVEGEGGKVRGVVLEDGSVVEADIVVANADLPYVYSDLLKGERAKQRASQLASLNYSASIISFNWCLDTRLDRLAHHNIFLSDEYEASWNRAHDPASLLPRPNFYVHAPQRTDPTAAPPGCDAITVLMPVGNLKQLSAATRGDHSSLVQAARRAVTRRFAEAGICDDIMAHIVSQAPIPHGAPSGSNPKLGRRATGESRRENVSTPSEDPHEPPHSSRAPTAVMENGTSADMSMRREARDEASTGRSRAKDVEDASGELVIAPSDWKMSYNLKHGAAFGLSHGLSQLAYFRPDVADTHVEGLYFVGASTRPGNGVPLVLIGASTTTKRILEDYGRKP